MSNTYQSTENLVDRVNRYIAENKKSITDVAGEIDYARSTLSQYLSGKYKSDSTEIEEKLIEFLEKVESDNSSVKINREFFISEDTGNIMAICKACQEEGELGMIVGRSGFGKTKTLKKYATLDRVVYIECDVSMACRDLIEAIEEGIGLPEGRGSIWKRVNTIKQFFEINKGYLLIVDEADKLISKDTITKLEILRTIFDHVKTKREEESSNMYSFGLVVAGEPNLESLIRTLDVRFANRICF
jgi:DNA transposition AAA+ family ATPase